MKPQCALLVALPFTATSLPAHHAFAAEYYENKLVTIKGTVSKITWSNPYAWLYVTGEDADGTVSNWGFEMGSPNGLTNRGWKKMELKKGDAVTVDGFRAKSGKDIANAPMLTLPDGRKLFGGFQSTPGNPNPPNNAGQC